MIDCGLIGTEPAKERCDDIKFALARAAFSREEKLADSD